MVVHHDDLAAMISFMIYHPSSIIHQQYSASIVAHMSDSALYSSADEVRRVICDRYSTIASDQTNGMHAGFSVDRLTSCEALIW